MADNFQQVIQLAFEVLGQADAQRVADVLGKVGDAGGAADSKLGPLIDKFTQLAEEAALVDKALDLKSRLDANEAALAKAKQSLADLNAEFSRTDKSSADVTLAFSQAEKQVKTLAAEQLKLQSASASTGVQLKAAGIDANQLGAAHTNLKGQTSQVASELVKAGKAAHDTAESHKEAAKEAKEAGTAFGFVKDHLKEIISIAAAVELALKGIEFGKESLKNAEALEAQLSRVKASAQGAIDEVQGFDDEIENAAEKANVTSQVAAAGMLALVNSGKSAKDAVAALLPTLQLAKIANIDVGQAAELVAKNLDAFNIPASQAAKVVDILTAASHGSATALAGISSAAAELAPDAKALGLDFDKTAGLLGLLADKGFNAGNSVRALRTIFQDLQNPTSTLRSELLSLGDGTSSLEKAVAALTSGTPRANQALLTLSGGARTVVELLGQAGPDAIAKFTAGLEAQNGVASKTVAIIDNNLRGASTRFGNSIDAIGEKLAKPVLEPFKNELNKLAEELNKFAQSDDFKEIETEVGEMAREGARAIDNFLHGIDWKTFLNDAKSSLAGVVDDLKSVADSASTIATAVNKTAAVIGTAYHGVAGAIDGVVGAAASAEDKVLGLGQRMADGVGQGDKYRKSMEGARAATQAVADEALENLDAHTTKLRKDLDYLTGSTDKATTATKAHGDAFRGAVPAVEQHVSAAERDERAFKNLLVALEPVPGSVRSTANAQRDAAAASQSFAQAMYAAAEKGRSLTGTTENLKTAFKNLHLASQQELAALAADATAAFELINKTAANTEAGLADKQNSFLAMAKAQLDATAQLGEGARASIRYQLESKAAVLGITEALKDLESQSAKSGAALTSDAARSAARLDQTLSSAKNLGQQTQAAGNEAEKAGEKYDRFADTGEQGFADLTQGIANARAGFLALSDAAAQLYDTSLKDAFDLGHSDDGSGFDRVARAMGTALDVVNQKIAVDRTQLKAMVGDVEQLGAAGNNSFGAFGNDAAAAAVKMHGLAQQIADGTYQVGVLGKQDLAQLQQSLEAAAQRAEQLAQKSADAVKQLADINDQLQDQLDANNGDKESQEDRRYKKQLQQLKELHDQAGQLSDKQYRDALDKAEKLHADALAKIQQEAEARNNPDGKPNAKSTGSSGGGAASFAGLGQQGPTHHLHITLGSTTAQLSGSPQQVQAARDIIEQIAAAQRNSI